MLPLCVCGVCAGLPRCFIAFGDGWSDVSRAKGQHFSAIRAHGGASAALTFARVPWSAYIPVAFGSDAHGRTSSRRCGLAVHVASRSHSACLSPTAQHLCMRRLWRRRLSDIGRDARSHGSEIAYHLRIVICAPCRSCPCTVNLHETARGHPGAQHELNSYSNPSMAT